jgi:DNA polymerase I-like protein with 3'-5' exonuclease and polymerase domains
MVKMAMVKIDEWIKENKLDDKVHMIAQVHDELLFEIDNKDEKFVEKTLKEIQEMMENILVNFPLMRTLENIPEVPIKVGVKQGKNWGKTEA